MTIACYNNVLVIFQFGSYKGIVRTHMDVQGCKTVIGVRTEIN